MVRFGVAGCGKHAEWAVMPAIAERAEHCALVAVSDPDPQRLEHAAAYEGVATYGDVAEMIRDAELDAVYVATPVDEHCLPTLAALEAGLHVVCEKPMAESIDRCREMLLAARRADRRLAITFENRYQPHFAKLREWVAAGHLGTVEAIHVRHFWDGHKTSGPLAERRFRAIDANGGLDCGIHTVDIVRYLAGGGEYRDVSAHGAWFGERTTKPPHVAILATLTTGPLVDLSVSMGYAAQIEPKARSEGLTIVGDRGVIDRVRGREGRDELVLTSETLCESTPVLHEGHPTTIARLLEDFAGVVEGRIDPPDQLAWGEDGLAAQELTEEANAQAMARREQNRARQVRRDVLQATERGGDA